MKQKSNYSCKNAINRLYTILAIYIGTKPEDVMNAFLQEQKKINSSSVGINKQYELIQAYNRFFLQRDISVLNYKVFLTQRELMLAHYRQFLVRSVAFLVMLSYLAYRFSTIIFYIMIVSIYLINPKLLPRKGKAP